MAFGNFIFNYVVDRALAESHPSKDFEHCVNRRQVKHPCTVCADICPQHVYFGKGSRDADFRCCTNCGLCVAACPARCIASSAANVSAYLKLLKAPGKHVLIASRQYGGNAHLKVNSFASLPWEYLACLGLRTRVLFLTADLPQLTPLEEAVWRKALASLELFFGKEEFERRFLLSAQPIDDEDVQEFSRRELFRKANEGLKSTISSFTPSESMVDGLLYRHLLRELLAKKENGAVFGWVIPRINACCKGCGICEKLCPQKAIAVKQERGTFRIALDPVRCNNCGLCGKVCPYHAVDGPGLVQLDSLTPLLLLDSTAGGK